MIGSVFRTLVKSSPALFSLISLSFHFPKPYHSITAMAASNSIRLRRTLRAISSLHRSFSSSATTSAPPISLAIRRALLSAPPAPAPAPWLSRSFRSSSISLWSKKWFAPTRRLVPRVSASDHRRRPTSPTSLAPTICWSRAGTTTTGSSAWTSPETTNPPPKKCVAEAKQKIYACSTTNYTGFQAVMSEGESKKFENESSLCSQIPILIP
ncbi:uncharacterized protein [Arachis hypogaea]|uniref:uncharacterized protein isoform X3 n=1 Tax=Arachis hypogaea TaxID=3818 RepID=UPI003B219C32